MFPPARRPRVGTPSVRLPCVILLCALATASAIVGFRSGYSSPEQKLTATRSVPTPGGEGDDLESAEAEWATRIAYPSGKFDPAWLRAATRQDAQIFRDLPAGTSTARMSAAATSALGLSTAGFTSLGPATVRTTGCFGCYDYGVVAGRVNAIAVDATTAVNGSITAYIGTNGGGVWKTTNCCTGSTSWSLLTDDPLISTTTIGTLAIDPNDHNVIYAGTGDLTFGTFTMGSQGILKSTDAGATWRVLGASVFGAALPEPAGKFPQYQAVGKVRVDPNNSRRVVAGTKTGLYFSYDAGSTWTGPCLTNQYSSQRQDITGLELTNMGGGVTRIIAAVGVRGFATAVQYNLDQNGANGIYKGTMPASGCASDFTLLSRDDNGFVFGDAVTGSAYATGDGMHAGSGVSYNSLGVGNQLGRVEIAVAPSNANYIYAQVQSVAANNNSGCSNKSGCQLGLWASTDGGATWSFVPGSAGGSLLSCTFKAGDYNQNWYDQFIAVDPNDPERFFLDTYDIWVGTRTGGKLSNLTCGYDGTSSPVHVDQHALAFVGSNSQLLLAGSDGGIYASVNADIAQPNGTRNDWFSMNNGLTTLEFYSGDLSANFASSPDAQAAGGMQDNGSATVAFGGAPTGPVQWQGAVGGDGFYSRIDPIGTGTNLRYFAGRNSGSILRCVSACTQPGGRWTEVKGSWGSDTQSFILPFDLFHGGIPAGDDCAAAGMPGGCGHLIAGTTRVWETITANRSGAPTWYISNNPSTQDMTKQALADRSHINQVKYSPKFQSVAIAGTNDGNVWIGFNLGTGMAGQANWVDVTGSNSVLANRPVLGIALDPSAASASVAIGYAAVGGFNANTPTSPGHLFQVTCGANCSSFTWANKTGNLPDIPVDSVIVNPNYPRQVFAGTDFGLYYTDDINAATPVWKRFNAGLPNAMIWDMQVDRGATTLSVWTRSRGAFAWPLPNGPISPPTSPRSRAVNLSTRLQVGTGDNQAIGGFIVTGDSAKRVIVRAIGPTLTASGVSATLDDPVLELHGADGALISRNDNWRDTDATAIQSTGIAPTDDRESAILATVTPGAYTAIVSGKNATSGVGLVEVYDLDGDNTTSQLANISTRGRVQSGGNVVIGGFIIGGAENPADMLLRGLGPSLASQNVSGVLPDPTLSLRDPQQNATTDNDNWQDDAVQAARISATGIAPSDAREAAIAATVKPGAYTVILAGKPGDEGVGIVEVYQLAK